jgi:glycosyltransferase involved in cell wall biosynthesis
LAAYESELSPVGTIASGRGRGHSGSYESEIDMMRGNGPLVGVVVPAYNEERYIGECIDSVLGQSYPNWHLVIVDNASTDQTFDIVQAYVAKDNRINVVRNETTVPVIENYNIAFRQLSPRAKYCKALGADDWLYPECLERMVGLAETNPSVALVGAFSLAGGRVNPPNYPFSTNVVLGREVCRNYLSRGPHLLGAATPLMFRADVVRSGGNRFFWQPSLHADAEACLRVLQHHDYGFVHQILTFTRVRDGSLSSGADMLNVYIPNLLEFLINFGPSSFSTQELKLRIEEQLAHYYSYLGGEVFRQRGRKFWAFHRDRLAELGYRMSMGRVLVISILSLVERVARRLRQKL